jgi:amino acid adenylation domain-containing protein
MTSTTVNPGTAFRQLEGMHVLAMVAEHVRLHPAAPAVTDPDETLDYGALAARAEQCAHLLKAQGHSAGELVAVRIAPSAAGICAVLGVLCAGGVLVPLDVSQPPLRQEQIIGAAGVTFVMSQDEDTGTFVVTETGHAAKMVEAVPDAAYLIHTSGSTGAPKGVMCGHAALANVVRAQRTVFRVEAADRVAQLAPWCVDAFLFEVFLALAAGACLQIATQNDRYPGPPLERFLARGPATVAVTTPSVLRALDPTSLPALRLLISAGDALLPELALRWVTRRRLVNAYGLTEATIWTSYAELDQQTLAQADYVPLGHAIAGCSLTVVDDALQPVPAGTPGQLCIRGAGVALGYLDADGFTARHFPVEPSGRAVLTGDFAVEDANDSLRFIGRHDEQVKLGGLRVELGEVRNVLISHPLIHDCAVRQDGGRLVAYVVAHAAAAIDTVDLIIWMEERLPIQMVPTLYVPMPALPLTAWGKHDTAALPAPDEAMAALRNGDSAPQGATQAHLAGILSDLLNTPAISPEDDLFLLGMTSLTMARLMRHVFDDFAAEVEPVEVFENPTLAGLATLIDQRTSKA